MSRRHRVAESRYGTITMPPGVEVSDVQEEDRHTWLEIEGPRQPDAYRDDATFPGGLSLYTPIRYDDDDVLRDVISMYVIWQLHEALEFCKTEDGRRLADPHPRDEDAMWTWLRVRVGRLLSDYRRRWPAEDGPTREDA